MKKKMKKAFTLVELLVVIAILAILSTVAIVGYNSFTEKAKISNDQSLVRQLNTVLQADEIVDGKAKTPSDALAVMEENGFDVKKMTPTATDYDIIWNEESNRLVLLDDKGNPVVEELSPKAHKNWQFSSTYTQIKEGFSVYLKDNFSGDTLTVNSGVDVGKNTKIKEISYVNNGAAKDVIIRTNGGKLTVKGPNDVVNHYGAADNIKVESVAMDSFHEFGSTKQIIINEGRLVMEKTSAVLSISVEPADGKKVAVDVTKKVTEVVVSAEYASRAEDITINGTTAVEDSAALVSALDKAKKFAPNATTVPETFVIDKENKTITIKDEVAFLYYGYVFDWEKAIDTDGGMENHLSFWYIAGSYYNVRVLLDCDIDFKGAIFEKGMNDPFGYEFDGQGHTISNINIIDGVNTFVGLISLSNNGTQFKNLVIDNVHVTANAKTANSTDVFAGIMFGYYQNSVASNITIKNSSVTGGKYTGAIVGSGYSDIIDCVVTNCKVSGQYKVGGVIGQANAEAIYTRKINNNALTNVTLSADDVLSGKTATLGKVVGYFNGNGECKNNTLTNVTGAEKNICIIGSGCTVVE